MKRKIMSLLLTACMVIALLPGSALAAGEASGQDAPPAAPPTEEQTPGQTPGGRTCRRRPAMDRSSRRIPTQTTA